MGYTNTFKLWMIVILILLCSSLVAAIDVSIVTGIKTGLDVKQDFTYASLKMSPETSYSINRQHSQILTVTNNYDKDLYFFVDAYFEKSLNNIQIQKLDYITKYTKENTYCFENYECSYLPVQEYQEPVLSPLKNSVKYWGNDKHYFNTGGVLIKEGKQQQFKINYYTPDDKGKWNIRVWAYVNDEWDSILDDKQTAIFDYVIDPLYDMSNVTTPNSFWKFDEGTGTNVNDENTTNNNDLTLGGGVVWTTGGVILNDTEYSASTTDYARDTAATGIPLTLGSVNFWTRPTSKSNGMYLFEFSDGSTNNRIAMIYGGSDELIVYDVVSASAVAVLTCPAANHKVNNGVYSMITYTWNTTSDVYELYVNATNVTGCTRLAGGNLAGLNYIVIGNSNAFGSGQANVGRLDEFGSWSKILTVYEMQGLFNSTIGCAFPFSSCGSSTVIPDYNITVQNVTFNTPVFETIDTYTRTINFSWGSNVTNISNVSLNSYNYNFPATLYVNGSNWSAWRVDSIRIPLTNTNNSAYQFNFTYLAVLDNGTNYTNTSSNYSVNTLWAYYPSNISYTKDVIEGNYLVFTTNFTNLGNISDVSLLSYLTWNNTNITGTYVSNSTTQFLHNYSYLIGLISPLNLTVSFIPYANITFNGTTLNRSLISAINQTVYQVYLHNCSNTSLPATRGINYTIFDEDTYATISTATMLGIYQTYDTFLTYARSYQVNSYTNSSHYVCIYPSFAELNTSRNLSYSAPGYITRTQTVNNFLLSSATQNITLFLGNISSVSNIIISLVDQNNQYVTNYTVETYLYNAANTSYTLLDQGISNYEGKVVFQLNTAQGYYYAFKVYDTNSTLVYYTQPPFKLYSTTYTFQLIIGTAIQFEDLININTMDVKLGFNNATKTFNYSWIDSNNVSSQYCLKVTRINVNFTLMHYNCSTTKNNSLVYTIPATEGTYLATAYITLYENGVTYPVANVYAYLDNNVFGNEGIFISFLYFILTVMAGAYNPGFALILGIMGLGFGYALKMSVLSYGSILTTLICALIFIIRGRK